MGWFASLGVMMLVMFGLNGWVQNMVMSWTGWTALWVTGLVGTFAIGVDSARNLRRFGYFAIGRPRFFFELSRGTLALAFLLCVPALSIALLLPNIQVLGLQFITIRKLVVVLVSLFGSMAVLGYLTSFLTGRRRHGRAYECTSWFFCVFGGMMMITFGYIAIPDPARGLLLSVPGILVCCAGSLLLGCGIYAEVVRAARDGKA
jgi:hypothetical protein